MENKEELWSGSDEARLGRNFVRVTLAVILAVALAGVIGPEAYARPAAIGVALMVFATLVTVQRLSHVWSDEISQHKGQADSARLFGKQIEELFSMTDMLQAAETHVDAGAVLMSTSQRLLPEMAGALYVFNNSRDRLDLAKAWNTSETFEPGESLLPINCWALKRGKPHINDVSSQTLCCMHHIGQAATLEVPMMARGQVFGLLMLACDGEDAYAKLREVSRVSRALADSMSLTLSNIALRETLRTQSLRDPLTGLYNRRYMEDALERYISLAERAGTATSVVMIDLDNFKSLNDQHGHAKGDAVLRDVANQLVSALRPSDVIARYGGEELVIIMPNCGLEDAAQKAETLRMRVESLSDIHGTPVTASFGVASVPQTATGPSDVIPIADAALYVAKGAGKNQVRKADKRAGNSEAPPAARLAVTG